MAHTDNDAQFRKYAGTVLWPTTPAVLTDSTACPACFAPLTEVVCRNCQLDLAHPAAHDLAALSRSASDALSKRVDVIGRIRYETAEAAAPAAPAAVISQPTASSPEESPILAPPLATPTTPPAPPMPPQPVLTDAPIAAPRAPRRSGVQVALLIAAVSLLSVFAIFFLVYAFINYGIVWRSVIIAAITVAAFVSASLLRRKRLVASAEGLAVFAVVLVYLDAYALRANDFFGLGTADAATYWGATITTASVGFILWHRLAGMRTASLVGWTGLAIGIGTLTWGLGDGIEPFNRAFIAIAGAATVGLAHVLIPRPPVNDVAPTGTALAGALGRPAFTGTVERILVLSTSAVALTAAFLVGWAVEPLGDLGGTIALGVVAVLAFTHAATAVIGRDSTPAVRAFGHAFATMGGISAAAAASATAMRVATADSGLATFVSAVSAAAIAVLLEVAVHRLPVERLRRSALFAAWGAVAVLGFTVLPPLAAASSPIAFGLLEAFTNPLAAGVSGGLAAAQPASDLAVVALASVVALAAAIWLLLGALGRRAAAVAWGTGIVFVLAAAQLPAMWMTLAAWFALAVVAFSLLLRRELPRGFRACLVSVLVITTALLFSLGWASLDTWIPTTIATIVVLIASRRLVRPEAPRATLLGVATVVLIIGTLAAARHLVGPAIAPAGIDELNAAAFVATVGPVLLALAAIGYRRGVTTLDRRTVFWIAGLASGASALIVLNIVTELARYEQAALLLPQPLTSLIASILLFGALLLWIGLPANAGLRLERGAASVAMGPVVLWLVDSFARLLALPDFAQSVVPITAALLTAAGALTLTLLRPSGTPRWAREAGVAVVGLPAVALAVASDQPSGWLVLLLGAITILLVAISRDGLFASGSLRRHLGWAALALATAGLWWRLSGDSVDALEPYVLPLAAALLAIAALIQRAAVNGKPPAASTAAPVVALSGLVIGILPLAANSVTGDPTRAYILFGVFAVLMITGSLIVRASVQPYLDVVALAGAIGVLVTSGGRALLAPTHNLVPDTWIVAAAAVLVIAAFGQVRHRTDSVDQPRIIVSQALVGIGILMLAGIEAQGFSDPTLGTVRAIATVGLLSALHVVAFVVDSAPLTRVIALVAIAFAGGSATVGMVAGALDPIELGTVPIAVALLVTGRIRMSAEPTVRSWRTLAPGLVVLLLPSLLATIGEPELWRLVGLGVVAVTVLIVGAVRRLQAPFILGLAVSLIHGFATFAPQIRAVYESQEWWLWAGLAGIVLLVLAIRYEKRIENLKDAVGRIAALR